jgi:hypothetical protein
VLGTEWQIPDVLTEYYLAKSGFADPGVHLCVLPFRPPSRPHPRMPSRRSLSDTPPRPWGSGWPHAAGLTDARSLAHLRHLPAATNSAERETLDTTNAVNPLFGAPPWPDELGVGGVGVCSTRLVSVAAQKFVAGIAEEAHWYAEQRQQASVKSKVDAGYDVRDKRKVLTTEDLAAAMKEVCLLLPLALETLTREVQMVSPIQDPPSHVRPTSHCTPGKLSPKAPLPLSLPWARPPHPLPTQTPQQ